METLSRGLSRNMIFVECHTATWMGFALPVG
jgi:hypothetical protein